jgi:hypothetical protein
MNARRKHSRARRVLASRSRLLPASAIGQHPRPRHWTRYVSGWKWSSRVLNVIASSTRSSQADWRSSLRCCARRWRLPRRLRWSQKMGSNGGTGYPNWLRCAKCRKSRTFRPDRTGANLEATGRTKPLRGHHSGYRCTNRQIEYRCRECGHIGWTKHMDAERLLKRSPASALVTGEKR